MGAGGRARKTPVSIGQKELSLTAREEHGLEQLGPATDFPKILLREPVPNEPRGARMPLPLQNQKGKRNTGRQWRWEI